MITIKKPFGQIDQRLGVVGRVGESGTREIAFDCGEILMEYPNAQIICAMQRENDPAAYLHELITDGGIRNLILTDADVCVPGSLRIELRAIIDDAVRKSAIYTATVAPSLAGEEDTPENPTHDILNRLEAVTQAAVQATQNATSAASDAQNAAGNAQAKLDELEGAGGMPSNTEPNKQFVTNGAGKAIWTDRLAYSSGGLIEWDGKKDGHVTPDNKFYWVSDLAPTYDELISGNAIYLRVSILEGTNERTVANFAQISGENGYACADSEIVVCFTDDAVVKGITFPLKGTYFRSPDPLMHVGNLKWDNISALDYKYILGRETGIQDAGLAFASNGEKMGLFGAVSLFIEAYIYTNKDGWTVTCEVPHKAFLNALRNGAGVTCYFYDLLDSLYYSFDRKRMLAYELDPYQTVIMDFGDYIITYNDENEFTVKRSECIRIEFNQFTATGTCNITYEDLIRAIERGKTIECTINGKETWDRMIYHNHISNIMNENDYVVMGFVSGTCRYDKNEIEFYRITWNEDGTMTMTEMTA